MFTMQITCEWEISLYLFSRRCLIRGFNVVEFEASICPHGHATCTWCPCQIHMNSYCVNTCVKAVKLNSATEKYLQRSSPIFNRMLKRTHIVENILSIKFSSFPPSKPLPSPMCPLLSTYTTATFSNLINKDP